MVDIKGKKWTKTKKPKKLNKMEFSQTFNDFNYCEPRVIDTRHKDNGCRQTMPEGFEVYNEDWYLSPQGDMCNKFSDYFIEADRLDEDDWFLHCMHKRWFDGNTFLPAYYEACKRAGIQEVTMRMYY